MNDKLYDINDVCKSLGVTSRALRFWEEKGIVSGTKSSSGRRQYTEEQVGRIKSVITLRALGLSVKDIHALQNNKTDIRTVVNDYRAAAYAAIEKKEREIAVLCEALSVINAGGDISDGAVMRGLGKTREKYKEYTERIAEAVVYDDTETLYSYLSDRMKEYLPRSAWKSIRRDTLEPLGSFVSFRDTVTDRLSENIVYKYAEYEKMGLRVKAVFGGDKVEGLWLTYFEL